MKELIALAAPPSYRDHRDDQRYTTKDILQKLDK